MTDGRPTKRHMRITAVIPTKNRPSDLVGAVVSIRDQSRPAEQLVVIDQSDNSVSREAVEAAFAGVQGISLTYVHNPAIPGLVAAKAASLKVATGDLVCFFEDDVVLERDYLAEIEQPFLENPAMMGSSGVITNHYTESAAYRFLYRLFHRGVFTDRRPDVYVTVDDRPGALVPSNIINGGLSAWRREVFEEVQFDVLNPFHMMEDAEFSARASRRFGASSLFINPKARLVHNMSPVNREAAIKAQRRKIFEYVMFYKKNRTADFSFPCFLWLLGGLALHAFYQSARGGSLSPLKAYGEGLAAGVRHRLMMSERELLLARQER